MMSSSCVEHLQIDNMTHIVLDLLLLFSYSSFYCFLCCVTTNVLAPIFLFEAFGVLVYAFATFLQLFSSRVFGVLCSLQQLCIFAFFFDLFEVLHVYDNNFSSIVSSIFLLFCVILLLKDFPIFVCGMFLFS